MRGLRVTFPGSLGHPLKGQLDLPDAEPLAYAVFAHCFTCNRNYKGVSQVSRALAEAGIGSLRFDFTGLGESGGDFTGTTFSSNVEDVVAAAAFLAEQYAPAQLLLGHSLGGAAVLQAAGRVDACRAVVTIGAPSDTQHLAQLLEAQLDGLDDTGEAAVEIMGRPFRVGRALLEDLARHDLLAAVAALDRALLVMHAPGDVVVPVAHAAALFGAARHPRSFVSLDTADHLMSHVEDGRYAGRVAAAWVQRYLGASRKPGRERT